MNATLLKCESHELMKKVYQALLDKGFVATNLQLFFGVCVPDNMVIIFYDNSIATISCVRNDRQYETYHLTSTDLLTEILLA